MFFDCNNVSAQSVDFIQWPDGGCYFDQEQITICVFNIIRSEILHILNQESKK